MNKRIIILGAGGHAKVVLESLKSMFHEIIGFTDINSKATLQTLRYIGDDRAVLAYDPEEILLVNGLGSIKDTQKRKKLFDDFKQHGYSFLSAIHPSAIIADDVQLGEGVHIMAGGIVQPGSIIGSNTIVNTKASIDHDCSIGNHVHIAPGVTLSGNITVQDEVHIGVGATIIQAMTIENNSIIGAGAVVIRDVLANTTVAGVPAREVTK